MAGAWLHNRVTFLDLTVPAGNFGKTPADYMSGPIE